MANRSIPAGAQLVRTLYANAPDGSQSVILRQYNGTASDGYKTEFRARPAVWLACSGTGKAASWTRRFTGRNLAQLDQQWGSMLAELRKAKWSVEIKQA